MARGSQTIIRVRKARVDKLAPSSVAPVDRLTITGTIVLPAEGYETGRGWVTYDGREIFILPSSRVEGATPRAFADGDIVPSDLIEIDGVTWAVSGPLAPYDKGSVRKATRVRVGRVGAS